MILKYMTEIKLNYWNEGECPGNGSGDVDIEKNGKMKLDREKNKNIKVIKE